MVGKRMAAAALGAVAALASMAQAAPAALAAGGVRVTVTPERTSLGIGLFISREIVQAHGGQLTVSSTAQEGTTFTLALPRRHGD